MSEKILKRLILIIIILILIVAGIFVYLYLGTDLLKSEEQLFYKYLGKALEIENQDKLIEYINKRKNNNYEIKGEYSANLQANIDEKTNEVLDKINNAKIEFTGKVDNLQNKNEHNFNIKYSNEVSSQFNFRSSNNILGFQNDKVSSKFIGIENNNIKDFMQNTLEIEDVSNIPNTIEIFSSNKTITQDFSKEEKEQLKNTYLNLLKNYLNGKEFTYEELDGNLSYNVKISNEEYVNILKDIFTNLNQDELVTSKIVEITGVSKEYITNEIDLIINDLNNNQNENNSEVTLSVEVSQNKNYTICIKEEETEIKFSTKLENDNFILNFEIINNQDTNIYFNLAINGISSNTVNTNFENGYLTNANNQEQKYIYKYSSNVTFNDNIQIEDFNNDNVQVLNNYSKEQVTPFVEQVNERLEEINKNNMKDLELDEDQNILIMMMPLPIASEIMEYNNIDRVTEEAQNSALESNKAASDEELKLELATKTAENMDSSGGIKGSQVDEILEIVMKSNEKFKNNENYQISVTVEASNWGGENKPNGKITIKDFDGADEGSNYKIQFVEDEEENIITEMRITDV